MKHIKHFPKKRWTSFDINNLDDEIISFMWNTYEKEYKKLGMDLSVSNVDDFKKEYKAVLLIDIDTDPMPDAFIIFSDNRYGNKINLLWTDGQHESKRVLVKKLITVLNLGDWWIEASLKIEEILSKNNIPYLVKEEDIKKLINKDIVYLGNGYYSRKLALYNKWITKRIYGIPKI